MDKIDFMNAQAPALNDENLNKMQDNIERAINAQVSGDTLPIGTVLPYTNETAPENWLVCDGSELDRTEYNHLFAIIGTTFGAGDGSTTFNLPNLKGRTIVGLDAEDADFNEIGKVLGEKTHTLTVAEIPEHTHKFRASTNLGNDEGTITYGEKTSGNIISGNYGNAIQKEGSSQSHNNIQPSFVGVYIIKAKQSAGLVATVVDSLDSTSATDALSAKQGKNLKEKIEKKDNFIIVGIFDNLSLSNTTNKIVFNKTLEHNGNLLTLNTNGEVVVGAGITKIEVSSAVFLEDFGGTGYSWAKIFKNDIQVTSAIVPVQQGIYHSASVASKAINVSEGDKIMLKVENSTSAKIRAGDAATFMCVKVIA